MLRSVADLTEPLTDEELDYLETFLLERVDEEAVTEGVDEGVLGVSELDGFLTALVSGPVTVMPSRWLPAVWGDFAPTWRTAEDFEATLALFARHMNSIADFLIDEPEGFEPMFLERVVKGRTVRVVDEWCEGYVRGVALTAAEWREGPPEIAYLLAPIRAFTGETDWLAHKSDNLKQVERLQREIAPNVRAIHAHWLRLRGEDVVPRAVPVRRDTPRVGRNDPCPCGSGKKYKKCCLQ
jgi:uncharacterized protein